MSDMSNKNEMQKIVGLRGYELLKSIYDTPCNKVYIAKIGQTNQVVAIKILSFTSEHKNDEILNEISILKHVTKYSENCKSCLNFYDAFRYHNIYFIVTEYLKDFIELRKYIKEYQYDPIEIFKLIWDAIHDLHSLNVVHLDIKARNIMINPLTRKIKLIDFGISCRIDLSHKRQCLKGGTVLHIPPELIYYRMHPESNLVIDFKKSDTWLLGIIAFELCTKKNIFLVLASNYPEIGLTQNLEDKNVSTSQIIKNMLTHGLYQEGILHPMVDKYIGNRQFAHFIKKCLSYQNKNRPVQT